MSSCSEISSQLAALSADIAALNNKFALKSDLDKYLLKEEKPQIIQQSVATAEQLWILAIAAGLVKVTELLRPEIEIAANIGKAASEVAGKALGIASKLAPLLPVLNVLLTLAAGGGILAVLGGRIDAVESGLQALGNDVSRLLGLLRPVKITADTALATANTALNKKSIPGERGLAGAAGARGLQGERGLAGAAGARGLQGERGFAGAAGARGLQGERGLAGAAGARGLQGERGLAGAAGATGLQGERGLSGAAGATGLQGERGLSGAAGVRGLQGERGLAGAAGARGLQGEPGLSGAAIQAKIRGLEGTITGIQAKIGSIEADLTGLKASIPATISAIVGTLVPPLVGALVPPIVGTLTPPLIGNLVPPIVNNMFNNFYQNIVNNITNITNNIVKVDLTEVLTKIDALPNTIIAAYIASPIVFQRTVTAAATGTCQTMQPGGCGDIAMQRNGNNLFDRLAGLFNTGANAAQLALLNVINTKLGQQITNAAGQTIGVGGAILRVGQNTVVDRLLNILTFAATVHNATQLSSNIAITLIQTMQNVLDTFGLKDGNDQSYNLSQLIGSSIDNFMKAVLGASTVESFKATWAQYSRIYQAGANVFTSLMSMGDSLTQGLQIIGGQTGKIGNALRAWGVVSEKAYTWMNPTPNFSNPLLTKLNSLEETASMVENVSQQPLNVKSAKEELEASSKALADSLEQKGEAPQAKPIPEASKVKEQQTEIKTSSKGKDLEDSDLEPDD
jgi:Collagen triple helix repeat (20 copies)